MTASDSHEGKGAVRTAILPYVLVAGLFPIGFWLGILVPGIGSDSRRDFKEDKGIVAPSAAGGAQREVWQGSSAPPAGEPPPELYLPGSAIPYWVNAARLRLFEDHKGCALDHRLRALLNFNPQQSSLLAAATGTLLSAVQKIELERASFVNEQEGSHFSIAAGGEAIEAALRSFRQDCGAQFGPAVGALLYWTASREFELTKHLNMEISVIEGPNTFWLERREVGEDGKTSVTRTSHESAEVFDLSGFRRWSHLYHLVQP